MKRILAPAALTAALLATPASAQQPQGQPPPDAARGAATQPGQGGQQPVVIYPGVQASAREVQQQLRDVLSQYPPSLPQIFRLDPSLLSRADYLAPYPALAAFLQQHPEVVRNPSYFFGEQWFQEPRTERDRAFNFLAETMAGVAFLAGFLTVVTLLYSLLRQTLEYRRWKRQVQIQTDVHTKLLDRMTNNQELLAYIETPAGRRFLESAPPPLPAMAGASPMTIAPVARILWSVQIGVVVAAIGLGFWTARASVTDTELSSVLQVMGTLAVAVGVGFVVSALVSWLLSQRMGLLNALKAES